MESIPIKKHIIKLTTIFLIIYIAIWLMPGIVIYPIDKAIELYRGYQVVDSWTHGVMGWLYVVIALPVIYLSVVFYSIYKYKKKT